MAALGIVWLGLLVLEFARGLSPALAWASTTIWVLFAIDFCAEFWIAPRKAVYLRRHWMAVLSLALPGVRILRPLRVVRVARAARALRGVRLLRTLTSLSAWRRHRSNSTAPTISRHRSG